MAGYVFGREGEGEAAFWIVFVMIFVFLVTEFPLGLYDIFNEIESHCPVRRRRVVFVRVIRPPWFHLTLR